MGGLKENKVHILANVPENRKAIPSKLIFKVKRGPDRNIVKLKAQVVIFDKDRESTTGLRTLLWPTPLLSE